MGRSVTCFGEWRSTPGEASVAHPKCCSFPYAGSVVLAPELDGVRILSADRHEFLQKVPDASSAVFRPGSTDPAALLFDASECFAQRSAKADEGIRAIKAQLASAVDTCIEAAGHEWDPAWQRKLLKVSSAGAANCGAWR